MPSNTPQVARVTTLLFRQLGSAATAAQDSLKPSNVHPAIAYSLGSVMHEAARRVSVEV
jgi:hypothetical protein